MNRDNSYIGMVDSTEDEYDNIYCPICQNLGFRSLMGPKLILVGQKREPDHDNWLQCPSCGWLCPIYQAEPEPQIQDTAETIESPYDEEKGIVLSTENRSSQTQRRRRKQAYTNRVTRPTSKRNKKQKLHADDEINYLLQKYGDNMKVIK